MSPENGNGEVLSSWKEISAYLKCGVRSCIRWEKERGLPVHRMAGPRSARVFAYRGELDAWLEKQLKNGGEVGLERKTRPRSTKRFILWIIPLAALAALVALVLILIKGRSDPPPFQTGRYAIITTEPTGAGQLRVWEHTKSGAYRNTWAVSTSRYNTVRHSTIAAGDIDGDGKTELAAPTYAKNTINRGEKEIINYVIFVNFYKDGIRGLWKTTFYSEKDWILEEDDYRLNEVTQSNLDNDPGNEIILKTASRVSVLDYQSDTKVIKLLNSIVPTPEGRPVVLRSLAVARLDHTGPNRIIVGADEIPGQKAGPASPGGWLLFIDIDDSGLKLSNAVRVDAGFQNYALRTGDVDRDGLPEIFAIVTRVVEGKEELYLLGWDAKGSKIADVRLPGGLGDGTSGAALVVNDITFEAGDDILVGLKPNRLILFTWQNSGPVVQSQYLLDTPGAVINAIGVADTDSDNVREIVVAGSAIPKVQGSGHFFLEVLGYRSSRSEFSQEWKRVEGAAGEAEVVSLAIARK